MIELSDVSRIFLVGSAKVHALRHIDLSVPAGDYVSLMGPSGSGKSTLLNVIGLLDRPTSGSYRLLGREVAGLDDAERTRLRRESIGFVFQTFHLIPRLSARGNVELPLIFAGVAPAERRRRSDDVLGAVGLSARAGHRPAQLSGGERQRVAIARAMMMSPSLLLADEPTGNLDRDAGQEVVRLLESLNREGLTLIVVTHNPDVGARARRCIRLRDGAMEPAAA